MSPEFSVPIVISDKGLLLRDEQTRVTIMRLRDPIDWKKWLILAGVLVAGLIGGVAIGWFIKPCQPAPHPTPTTTTTPPPPPTKATEEPTTTNTVLHDTIEEVAMMLEDTPFPPPTTHPLPEHPENRPPVSLLYEMGMNPTFTVVNCAFTSPIVYKYNVTVAGHTFTSLGGDRKQTAKNTAAMVANEAIFGFKYATIPVPKSECKVVSSV